MGRPLQRAEAPDQALLRQGRTNLGLSRARSGVRVPCAFFSGAPGRMWDCPPQALIVDLVNFAGGQRMFLHEG